jgi:uncharacterized protein (TIGR00159 family)
MEWSFNLFGQQIPVMNILDLALVIFIIIQLYRALRGSLAFNIFIGIVVVYLSWIAVRLLQMPILSEILNRLISVGIVALIIVFQPEIRRFLLVLGKKTSIRRSRSWARFLGLDKFSNFKQDEEIIYAITLAVTNLMKQKTGALIVLAKTYKLKYDSNSGVLIDGFVSARLLESIFKKESPLHDGAVIISNYKLIAANVMLPLSENPDLPIRVGMRHRAAVGVTEKSDAVAIIVSEERGQICFATDGKLIQDMTPEELKKTLYDIMVEGN